MLILVRAIKQAYKNFRKDIIMDKATVTTLSNGIKIANFSSAHEFKFVDGSKLSACSDERCRNLMLKAVETEFKGGDWTDIKIRFDMTSQVLGALKDLDRDDSIDIILCPLPVMTALKDMHCVITKARGLRMADRVTKEIHIDRFCI